MLTSRRYFLEVSYKGTHYSGFQVQKNAPTIQGTLQAALYTICKNKIILYGSSRTDTGVHALQNFFHFDTMLAFEAYSLIYSLNALLPHDIAVVNIFEVDAAMHARFSAVSRQYRYCIIHKKNPFYTDTAYLFQKHCDLNLLNQAAMELFNHKDFSTFSKMHTQVYTHNCDIMQSCWHYDNDLLVYEVRANRFLRGMVRALVGTMLKVGTGKMSIEQFIKIILAKDYKQAYFDAPAKGLCLINVAF